MSITVTVNEKNPAWLLNKIERLEKALEKPEAYQGEHQVIRRAIAQARERLKKVR